MLFIGSILINLLEATRSFWTLLTKPWPWWGNFLICLWEVKGTRLEKGAGFLTSAERKQHTLTAASLTRRTQPCLRSLASVTGRTFVVSKTDDVEIRDDKTQQQGTCLSSSYLITSKIYTTTTSTIIYTHWNFQPEPSPWCWQQSSIFIDRFTWRSQPGVEKQPSEDASHPEVCLKLKLRLWLQTTFTATHQSHLHILCIFY